MKLQNSGTEEVGTELIADDAPLIKLHKEDMNTTCFNLSSYAGNHLFDDVRGSDTLTFKLNCYC